MASACQRKVAIAGAGAVGSTFAYALVQSGLVDEIVLIDQNKELTYGQAMNLAYGGPFFHTVSIRDGNSSDYGDSHLIVITAGTASYQEKCDFIFFGEMLTSSGASLPMSSS